MFFSKIKQKVVAVVLILSFIIPGITTPIGLHGIQKADAIACSNCKNVGQGAADLTVAGAKLGFANLGNFKEFVLDPLVWALINNIITNMLQELTRWVNSGFQGKPSFVTDLEGFLLDALDETVGEFLADQGLEFLCSPFKLDVKIALNITYQQARNNTVANECRLTDMAGNIENFLQGTFSEGGWDSWFELTMSPTADPNKAFLENRARLRVRLLDQYGRELTEVAAKDFFLDIKICEGKGLVLETKNKKAPKDCVVTTPGRVVEAQVNDALGLPRQRLAFADEFDELIGALLAQLANRVLTGINGLLGLGGSDYSAAVYGSSGEQTYLEALGEEAGSTLGGIENILDAIDAEVYYSNLMKRIVGMVDDVETKLNTAKNDHPSCFGIRMTPELTDIRDKAKAGISDATANLAILNDLYDGFAAATSTDAQADVIEDFYTIQADIISGTQTATIQAEIDIDYVIPDKISALEAQIQTAVASCEAEESR